MSVNISQTKMVPTYIYRMHLYHCTQITLKIQRAFKLLPDSIQQTVRYSIITPVPLFIANIVWNIKNPFRRSNLQKTENYQGFFCLTMREIPILSSIDRWKDFQIRRRRQADGDDHWPVIVTSKNVSPRCRRNLLNPGLMHKLIV